MTDLLPAELAWYTTGRFYEAEDGPLQTTAVSCSMHDAPLFDGERGEAHGPPHFAA